jgi:hypothetical protein
MGLRNVPLRQKFERGLEVKAGQTIGIGYGKLPIVQKTGAVPVASATAVHAAVTLTTAVQIVTTGITNPTIYRALQVEGNASGIAGTVLITGTDWAGRTITESFTLSGSSAVVGTKPFKTVTSIQFPAKTNVSGDTVSVGIADVLGLYRPIAAAGDVIETARKASAAAAYTIEATGTVDATCGTVAPSGGVTASDSFEFTYLTSTL